MRADKSQEIRLIDVFIIAPVMMYAGTIKSLPLWLRAFMLVVGFLTLVYNGRNYLLNKK